MSSWLGTGVNKSLTDVGSVEIPIGTRKSLSVNVTGTWVGTLVVEVSPNGGADAQVVSGGTWVGVRFFDPNALTFVSSITANGTYVIPDIGGMTHARVRCSAFTSGTIVIEEHAVETPSQIHTVTVTGTAATDLGKATDSPYASGETGVLAEAVRKDTPGALSGSADGSHTALQTNSAGELRTEKWALEVDTDALIAYEDGLVLRPTITTTDTAYSAGDVIGGIIALAAPLASGSPVSLRSIVLKDDKNAKPDLQILFFRSSPAGTYTDNAAVAPSTADMGALVGIQVVAAADWVTIQGAAKAVVQYQIDEGPVLGPATTNLYMVIVAVSAPDYAANSTDLTAELGFARMS